MRKLLRSMKKNQIRKIGRGVVTVSLAAGLMAGSSMMGCGSAAAFESQTSTVGLDLSYDKTSISSAEARVVNFGIMGLDSLGNVDTNAEAGGSTILASVSSVLGEVQGGGSTPSASAPGTFNASTKYVDVVNGRGMASVTYATSTSGTDTITVTLYEARTLYGGTLETREIASKTFNVSVSPASASAGILNFESFTPANGDPAGNPDATGVTPADDASNNGLTGAEMQAGYPGGQLTIKAYTVKSDRTYQFDSKAEGEVTVTFTGLDQAEGYGDNVAEGTSYTVTGNMIQGVATVTIPSTFTKAGKYKMVAQMGGITSVPQTAANASANTDYLTVVPKATPAKVGLSVDMDTVMNSNNPNYVPANHQATVTATLLDEYGNKLKKQDLSAYTVKFTDANSKVSISQTTFGNNVNSLTASVSADTNGTASVTAEVKDSVTIDPSDPLTINVKAAGLALCTGLGVPGANCAGAATWTAVAQTAGSPYDMLAGDELAHTDGSNFTSGTAINVYNVATKETATTSADTNGDDVTNLSLLYTKAAAAVQNFILIDPSGEYGSFKGSTGAPFAINAATPTKAKLTTDINGAGDTLSTVVASQAGDGSFEVTFNNLHFNLYDNFGNKNNGTVTIKYLSGSTGTATNNSQIAGTNNSTKITYPAGTTADDTLSFVFTGAPGINPDSGVNEGAGVKVTFPTTATLSEFVTYPETEDSIQVPINGLFALDIYPRAEDGTNVNPSDGYKISYDANGLTLKDTGGTTVTNGTVLPAGTGRYALAVYAGSVAGNYTITIESLDGTVSKTVDVKVVEYTVPLTLGDTSITVAPGSSGTVEIIGGSSPYTVSSADESVVTASVDGNSLMLNAIAEGGPVEVTVTDSLNASATLNVMVSANATVPDLGPSYGLDGDGNSISTETTFSGGVSVAGGTPTTQATVSEGDQVSIQLTMSIDPAHQGQAADMIALVGYMPEGGVLSWFIKPASDTENWVQWYGDLAELSAYKTVTSLNSEENLDIFTGALIGLGGGTVQAYGAYRLDDGTLIWNQQPVIINVTQ